MPSRGVIGLAPLDRTQGEEVSVKANNYSRGGLQVVSPQPFAEESLVGVAADNIECRGVIRYCNRSAAGFLIGIELVEPPVIAS